jgi:predicted PurR-regulated permease PerM
MQEKIKSLRGAAGTSRTLERAADVLQDLGKEINKPKEPVVAPSPQVQPFPPGEAKPIPVEVRQPPPTALENIATLIASLLRPLATTGIIAIFLVFILMQREDLRNRFIKLAGAHDLQKTTAALDDAGSRLSRLFLMQLALNTAFGVVIGVGLWIIGIPSPVLWGVLAAVLRFVPYIGALISAVFPLILAAAVDPGWSMLLWTAALFLVVEPIVGHVIEPVLFGRSTGLSPVAVVASATFWTTLWGPVGIFAGDAVDGMLGGARPSCRAIPVPRCDVRRSAGALALRIVLSAAVSRRSGRGRRQGGGVTQGAAAVDLL